MFGKLIVVFGTLLLGVQCIFGQALLPWKTFMFYDLVTDYISADSSKQMIKVYAGPINHLDIDDYWDVTNANVDTAYTLEIDDSRFSEYIMSVLTNIHSYYKIQYGIIGTFPNQYKVYRFHPHSPLDEGVSFGSGSNLHSFGLGINTNGSGTIMLDLWLATTDVIRSIYVPVISASDYNALKKVKFILRPDAKHSEKVKFDYMVAGLVNYQTEYPISHFCSGTDCHGPTAENLIEVIEIVPDSAIGLRFHTPKPGLGLNP